MHTSIAKHFSHIQKPTGSIHHVSAEDFSKVSKRLRERGELVDATIVLGEGINIFPKDGLLWNQLAKILQERFPRSHDMNNVIQSAYETASALRPDDIALMMNYAGFFADRKKFYDAEKIYKRIYNTEGPTEKILSSLSRLYERAEEFGLAAVCLRRALEIPDVDQTLAFRHSKLVKQHNLRFLGNWEMEFDKRMGGSNITPKNGPQPKSF